MIDKNARVVSRSAVFSIFIYYFFTYYLLNIGNNFIILRSVGGIRGSNGGNEAVNDNRVLFTPRRDSS